MKTLQKFSSVHASVHNHFTIAKMVWETINLPNLNDHIVAARERADIVIRKGADHSIEAVGGPWSG